MSSELEKQQTAQKLSTLRFQNGKLSAQLQVQRNQISDLESKLEQQDAKRDAYADTLLTVNSLWNQLNTDIRFLSSRCVQVLCYYDALFNHLRGGLSRALFRMTSGWCTLTFVSLSQSTYSLATFAYNL
jgi:hypothetical protein